jgi:hypothetical protein
MEVLRTICLIERRGMTEALQAAQSCMHSHPHIHTSAPHPLTILTKAPITAPLTNARNSTLNAWTHERTQQHPQRMDA